MVNNNDKRNPNKRKVKDADRIFSYSSITAPMMNHIGDNGNENADSDTSAEGLHNLSCLKLVFNISLYILEESEEDAPPAASKKAKVVTKSKLKNMAKRKNH